MAIIQVTSSASKEVMPDRTKLMIIHKVHRYDYEELSHAVSTEKNILSSAVAHLTDAKIIIESSYTTPVYTFSEKKQSRINNGYEYSGRYYIDLPLDSKIFNDLTLALTSLNLNLAISNNDYYSEIKKISNSVTAMAIREANAKATAIAAEINSAIIGVDTIEYNSSHMPMLMRAANDGGNFDRKPITVNESVTIKFIAK